MQMKLIALASLALAVSLAGCANSPGIKASVVGANIEIAKQRAVAAAKPLVDIKIPMQNCSTPKPTGKDAPDPCVLSVVVQAPQGAGNGQIAMPDDPAWRVAGQAIGVLGTGVNFLVGGKAAIGLVQATAGGIVGALRSAPDPVIVQPATPIIVPPAEPVIVNPVIVPPADPVIVEPVIVEPVIVNPVVVQAP